MAGKPKRTRKTCRELILERLRESQGPVALHELGIYGHSPISQQRRLYELKAEGKVTSRLRKDHNYLEWSIFRSIPEQPVQGIFPGTYPRRPEGLIVGAEAKPEVCGSCGSRSCICRAERQAERDEEQHHDRY